MNLIDSDTSITFYFFSINNAAAYDTVGFCSACVATTTVKF